MFYGQRRDVASQSADLDPSEHKFDLKATWEELKAAAGLPEHQEGRNQTSGDVNLSLTAKGLI